MKLMILLVLTLIFSGCAERKNPILVPINDYFMSDRYGLFSIDRIKIIRTGAQDSNDYFEGVSEIYVKVLMNDVRLSDEGGVRPYTYQFYKGPEFFAHGSDLAEYYDTDEKTYKADRLTGVDFNRRLPHINSLIRDLVRSGAQKGDVFKGRILVTMKRDGYNKWHLNEISYLSGDLKALVAKNK